MDVPMNQQMQRRRESGDITFEMIRSMTGFELADLALIRHKMAASMGKQPKDVSMLDLAMFARASKTLGIDPIVNQDYWINREGRGTFQLGIDGLRSIADRAGNYAGSSPPTFRGTLEWRYKGTKDKEPQVYIVPEYAQVVVWKIVEGHKAAFTGEARWVEFVPSPGSAFMWAKMPRHMLAKCAEAQALRKGWALQMSGAGFTPNDEPVPVSERVEVSESTESRVPQKRTYDDFYKEDFYDIPATEKALPEVAAPDAEPEQEAEPEVDEWARYRTLRQQAINLKLNPHSLRNETPIDVVREYNDTLGEMIEQAGLENLAAR
jgi:hypothetical protein